nr:ATP-binding cassette domain-containing protein [Frankia sp. Cppng1_Ct_nod]
MSDMLGYAVLSLGTGALYALVASGVVVIQRGTGVLNFAQGALVMWSAYFFSGAHEGLGLPLALAGVLTVAVTAGMGFAFAVLVMRPLGGAPQLTRVMATLGLLIILQALIGLFYGAGIRSSPSVLPIGQVALSGTVIGVDVFVRLAVVTVVVVTLWAGFRFTTLGLATTAVVENPLAAAASGWSANAVAAAAWCAGSAIAGLAGVLLAPLANPLSSANLIMLVVPALAVALIAHFRSFPGVLAGGLALGLVELETQVHLITGHPGWSGADRAIPLVVIIFYLVVRGGVIPGRGHVTVGHPALGSGRIHWPALVLLLATALSLIWFVLPDDWVNAVGANAIWALLMLSLVVLVGFTGQISLGQLSLAGVAALIAGRLVAVRHWPLEAALVVGVLGAVLAGLLFALPALRTRGLQLAVVTLGMGAAADAVLFQRGYHSPPPSGAAARIFGKLGSPEGTIVGSQSFLGVELNKIDDPAGFATLVLVVFTLVALAVANLRRGRAGRRLIAVRTNERAAAALGISVVGAKLYAFALSAAIAGFGGVLYAFYQYGELGNINYGTGMFAPFGSIVLIAFAVVGGIGWVSGSFAGATMVVGALGTRVGVFLGDFLGRLGWLARLAVVAGGGALGRTLGRTLDRRMRGGRSGSGSRHAPWAGAAVLAALAVVLGSMIDDWLVQLDRYMPLVSGVVLLMIMIGSGGGMAAENARTFRRILDRTRPAWHVLKRCLPFGWLPPGCPPFGRTSARPADVRRERRLARLLKPAAGARHPTVRPACLSISGLTVTFGGITAVRDVGFAVDAGEMVGLIGPNGAGKTTVIDAVSGYNRPASGMLMLGGTRLDQLCAHRRARAGIGRSFQQLDLFEDLTVLENIQAASDPRDTLAYLTNLLVARERPLSPMAVAAIDVFGLRDDLFRRVSELPYGRRRLLAVARAVAASPSVLLLDEPCAGLDEAESARLAGLLRLLADDWGLAILLNEHDMNVVMGVCDRVVVLDAGNKIAEGSPDEVRGDVRVRTAYLGEAPPSRRPPGRPRSRQLPLSLPVGPAVPGHDAARIAE